MKNSYGTSITVTLFGESHGDYIGATLDGLAPGIKIDTDYIKEKLRLRRPSGKISTARVEEDEYILASGAFEGYTTGTPLTFLIPNNNKKSSDYRKLELTPRPGHADYAAECKYHGYEDPRGGGHFSGRITAALVAVGALLGSALESKGIKIATHISRLGKISDRGFDNITDDAMRLSRLTFPVLSEAAAEKMRAVIEAAAADGDSVGGVLETVIAGVPAGVGEPWFDTVEGLMAHAMFSIPGIKGVEFGAGFGFADLYGSEANDPFRIADGQVGTETNNNCGVNGGITNGMPIIFRLAVKPTPSIFKEQRSVNLSTMENVDIKIQGRHDPAIIHRARAVVDAVAAIVIADALTVRYGTDYLRNADNVN